MNESDYQFITIALFFKLTGIPPTTTYYYCDLGLLPYVIISCGKKKKTRLINYRKFLQLMDQREKPVIPRRIDKRPAGIKLLEMVAEVKRGRSQVKNSKTHSIL